MEQPSDLTIAGLFVVSLARRVSVDHASSAIHSVSHTATRASTCLANRFRAMCNRRLMVPSGA
ncbi:MAG: hypothetical protein KDA62_12755, partial [Planctomycetales bacterium]|nr:hypothetical protein [Planctomycetales bacterium]